jgi:transcriptional regulator with XRE-family HTH domain
MNNLNSDSQNIYIGKKLKNFFHDLGYTQQYIAVQLGVSQSFVNRLLNGKPFGKQLAKKWGDAFGIQPNWLLTGEGEMLKNQPKNNHSMIVLMEKMEKLTEKMEEIVETNKKLADINRKLTERILEFGFVTDISTDRKNADAVSQITDI